MEINNCHNKCDLVLWWIGDLSKVYLASCLNSSEIGSSFLHNPEKVAK